VRRDAAKREGAGDIGNSVEQRPHRDDQRERRYGVEGTDEDQYANGDAEQSAKNE
jgi:hypothetical protein